MSHPEIEARIERGFLILRGSIFIKKLDFQYQDIQIFDQMAKLDKKRFHKYLIDSIQHEIAQKLDEIHEESKKQTMDHIERNIKFIFGIE